MGRLVGVLAALALLSAPQALPQDMALGRDVFLARCAKCHGDNGVPRRIAKGAPNLTDPRWSLSLERIKQTVMEGKGEIMPPFKAKLDLEQVHSVAAFVQTINKGSLAPGGERVPK